MKSKKSKLDRDIEKFFRDMFETLENNKLEDILFVVEGKKEEEENNKKGDKDE
jgi:hypothetical protein